MKRFITLILMLTILVTFTQKVAAFAPVLNDGMVSMVHCPMAVNADSLHKNMSNTACGDDMSQSMDCQSYCDLMSVVSVLHFIVHTHAVNQLQLQLSYQADTGASPYYFPESLYRPPFLN